MNISKDTKSIDQIFEKLKAQVITEITRKLGRNGWQTIIYENPQGYKDCFYLHGDGTLSMRTWDTGGPFGGCTQENIWKLYKIYTGNQQLTKKQALEMAVSRFQELLETTK